MFSGLLLIFFYVIVFYVIHATFFLLLHIRSESVKVVFFFPLSSLLCCKALTLSLIWYSGPTLLSSLSLGHLSLRKLRATLSSFPPLDVGLWMISRVVPPFPAG